MKPDKLMEFLRLGENQAVEFKTTCKPQIVGQQVCAFLNGQGGYVVCGVGEHGEIVGTSMLGGATAFEAALAQGLEPKAFISVETHKIEGKEVLVVEVPAGKDVPYAFENQVFVREGDRTTKASIAQIKDMVMHRQAEPERWERRLSTANIERDVANEEVAAVAAAAGENHRAQLRNIDDMQAVLQDLSAARYGRLTNAGDVFFTTAPDVRHPQVRVRAVCFASGKTDDTYHDTKTLSGPLMRVLEKAYTFIVRNTATVSRFSKGRLDRQDEPFYPADAIREGLVNAFAHRDYADYKGGLTIQVYPERLEIWNSGSLPEGITPETLAKGHISVLRNPDVAHMLYLRGAMEKIGRGSLLILKKCRDRKLPAPTWTSNELGVTLTFWASDAATQPLGTDLEQTWDKKCPKYVPSLSQVCPKSVPSEVVKAILRTAAPNADMQSLMHAAGHTNRSRFRKTILTPLVEAGLLEMTIPDKPRSSKQRYALTEKGKETLRSPSRKTKNAT